MNGAHQYIVATKCARSGGKVASFQVLAHGSSIDMPTHTSAMEKTYRYGERDLAHTIANPPDTRVVITTAQTQ
jgi:hypothetical protein